MLEQLIRLTELHAYRSHVRPRELARTFAFSFKITSDFYFKSLITILHQCQEKLVLGSEMVQEATFRDPRGFCDRAQAHLNTTLTQGPTSCL